MKNTCGGQWVSALVTQKSDFLGRTRSGPNYICIWTISLYIQFGWKTAKGNEVTIEVTLPRKVGTLVG